MAAGNIKGITIEINGNTTGLTESLKGVNTETKKIQNELKEVEKALKLDPGNTTLVAQKMDLLADAVNASTTKLDALKAAQAQVQAQFDRGDIGEEQYRAFQRELANTESQLRRYQTQMQSVSGEQDKLSQNQRDLQTYLNATGQSVDDLSRTLGTRLTNAIKDGSASADQLELALNRIGRQAGHSGEDLEQFRQTLRTVDNGSSLDEVRQDLSEIGQEAEETKRDFSSLTDGIKTGALAASAAITGIGVGAGLAAAQFDNAIGQIQAGLGVTREEAEALEAQARGVWKAGFGESLEEVAGALIRVKQNMKAIDGSEIEEVTQNALALAKTFDSDVNEVTRAGNNLMTNFGVTSEEAFDMMAKGAQNGLNFSNEMFDNLAEYAPLWSDMGFSAEEMFGILEAGAKSGVYNLDYMNDVMKEFQIRATDGSKATKDALAQLSPETRKVWKAFSEGKATVADMSDAAVADLAKINDKVKQNEVGVALFGTKWEDLGGDVVLSMLEAGTALEGFQGAMDGIAQAQEQTFGQRWESFTRTAASSLEPIGRILLDLAEEWLPKVISAVESVSTWFTNLSPLSQGLTVAFGAITAAIGPLIVVVGSIASALGTLIPIFATGGAGAAAFSSAIAIATGPIGLTVAAIVGLGIAIGAVVKNLSESSIEVDNWKNKVSEGTAQAVGSFMDLSTSATTALNQLAWGGQAVTQEMATNLIGIYDQMGQQVLAEMQTDHAAQLQEMTNHFASSVALTETEEAEILAKMQQANADKEKSHQEAQARIAEILNTAKEQKRAITEAEQVEINAIQETMKTNAIQYMTESQAEQKVILETLKSEASEITAQQAADVVKNAVKQKDEVIAEAQSQYESTVAEYIRQRDETGVISAEQADKLIKEAQKTRDETTTAAEEMHENVVSEAKLQADEHVEKVDWTTGEVKSKWAVMKQDVTKKMKELGTNIKKDWTTAYDDTVASVKGMVTSAKEKFEEIKTSVSDKMGEVKAKVEEKWAEAETFLEGINLLQIGKDIVAGLVKGIGDKFGDVRAKIEELAENIPEWAKKILGIHSPSRVFAQIGRWISEGWAIGIEEKGSMVENAVSDIALNAKDIAEHFVDEEKKLRKKANVDIAKIETDKSKQIASIEKRMHEDIAKNQRSESSKKKKSTEDDALKIQRIRESAAVKIAKLEETSSSQIEKIRTDSNKKIFGLESEMNKVLLEETKRYIDDKKSLDQLTIIEEAQIWEQSMRLFAEGTKERVNAQQEYKKATETVNKEITAINTDMQGQINKVNEELIKQEETLTKAYEDAVSKRASSLYSFKNLFDEFKVEIDVTGQQLLNNLGSQVQGFKVWQKEIEKLSEKAIDKGLLAELREMGPNALPQLIALNSMTSSQLTQYSDLYKEKSSLARKQAETELIGMKNDTDKQISELRSVANKQLDTLGKEWNEKIKSLTKSTATEFSNLKQVGVDAGNGLLQGLSSTAPSIEKKAKEIAESVSRTIQNALKIKSPSRVMMGFGVNVGEGLIIGMDDMIKKVANSSARLSEAVVDAQGSMSSSAIKSSAASAHTSTLTTNTTNNTPVNIVLNYNGTGSAQDALNIVDIVERELGNRFNNQLRLQGNKG